MVPRIKQVVYDGLGCVVKLILNVHIGELLLELSLITYANELGDVDMSVGPGVLHKFFQEVYMYMVY